ncbi:Dual adapter for phosphotyrosine and 3-phosphotyrosine and 3-phosphoinositide [Geodia barretti]|nr:Dual adapter for phosphotyrosine and 3-phosphotyrosine and 3-phosphoinositide [Geodia barretti]
MGKPNCFRLVLPYRAFYMIATTEAEAEDWVTFLRWRLENNPR